MHSGKIAHHLLHILTEPQVDSESRLLQLLDNCIEGRHSFLRQFLRGQIPQIVMRSLVIDLLSNPSQQNCSDKQVNNQGHWRIWSIVNVFLNI